MKWRFSILAPNLPEMRLLIRDLAGWNVRYFSIEADPSPVRFFVKVGRELFMRHYDLVHSHGFTSGMCVAIPAFVRRTPHLLTSHDIINEGQFAGTQGKIRKLFIGFLFRLIDTIHNVSHDAKENLVANFPSLGRRGKRCVVIDNGIEVERFEHASPRDLKGELGVGKEVFLIGFLGRFMSQKGFRYLVDAIEILIQKPDLPRKFLVVAFGQGGFIREERQSIKNKGLDKYFRFLPFASDVAGTIKGLDVLTMPSLWEACPLLAMEAMVSGVPVIGTVCIGLREVLRNTPSKIVSPKNSTSLFEAIWEEMKMPSTERAKEFSSEAARRFNVKQRAAELEKLMLSHLRHK
jgi:glycosyltransferase involved in cell wall biosynthesis